MLRSFDEESRRYLLVQLAKKPHNLSSAQTLTRLSTITRCGRCPNLDNSVSSVSDQSITVPTDFELPFEPGHTDPNDGTPDCTTRALERGRDEKNN